MRARVLCKPQQTQSQLAFQQQQTHQNKRTRMHTHIWNAMPALKGSWRTDKSSGVLFVVNKWVAGIQPLVSSAELAQKASLQAYET